LETKLYLSGLHPQRKTAVSFFISLKTNYPIFFQKSSFVCFQRLGKPINRLWLYEPKIQGRKKIKRKIQTKNYNLLFQKKQREGRTPRLVY
jgi:hypothetical protein